MPMVRTVILAILVGNRCWACCWGRGKCAVTCQEPNIDMGNHLISAPIAWLHSAHHPGCRRPSILVSAPIDRHCWMCWARQQLAHSPTPFPDFPCLRVPPGFHVPACQTCQNPTRRCPTCSDQHPMVQITCCPLSPSSIVKDVVSTQ